MEARSIPKGVTVLKIYFIVLGIIYVLLGLILPPIMMATVRASMEAAGEFGAPAVAFAGAGLLWGFLLILFLCWGILMIIIGLHLSKGYRWARIGAIIVGVWSLCSIPVGTVLGILCLAFLENEEGWAYFHT